MKKSAAVPQKSRVRIFKTIGDALSKTQPGEKWSTGRARRLYVTSKASWGKKSSGKIAKGFTPGSSTPGASFSSITAHAKRTAKKFGHASAKIDKSARDTDSEKKGLGRKTRK